MKTKEKANELWTTYRFALSIKNAPLGEQKDLIAKQCALIAVEEILECSPAQCPKESYEMEQHIYWQQVKTEINNL